MEYIRHTVRLNIFSLWQRNVCGILNEVEIVLIHLATILGKQLSCLISILLPSYSCAGEMQLSIIICTMTKNKFLCDDKMALH